MMTSVQTEAGGGAVRGARSTGGRRARKAARSAAESARPAIPDRLTGGTYRPLGEHDIERIHRTALDVLAKIGMADPIPELVEHAVARGCVLGDDGRLRFPRALVEDVIAAAPKEAEHLARDPEWDTTLEDRAVHFDPGGESVMTLDFDTGQYRPSTLVDLYDFARLVDALPSQASFGKVVVPTDVEDHYAHDISTAYAQLAGTRKHVDIGFSDARHMDAALAMLHIVAGGENKYRGRPFASSGGCPVVSPLKYGADNSEVCARAPMFDTPVSVVMAPQAGATAPAALAGTLVQVTAETLAALLLVQLIHPGHPVVFGPWPFVSDLRTGAFSGGGGEQALLAAGAAQVAGFYNLPNSTGAGMSDSKLNDIQAGYEKGITTVLAALAGCNSVSEVCGMTASLLGCSFEAMVADDEMLTSVQRIVRGIEVTDETLSYDVIAEAVAGPGHYLSHPQTLALMQTEYHYPALADRRSPGAWAEANDGGMIDRARDRAREILSTHYPDYIADAADRKIRERFPIHLPREAMRADCGRW